jgi:disulfide bond formation protein DsbB
MIADRRWGRVAFWGAVAFVAAYCGVLLGAFTVQFVQGEFPCPLCMLQRYCMILAATAAMWIVMQAMRGGLTRQRYVQALGLAILAALAGSLVSIRQILLHILPGDPGYGSAVLGLHLYSWAWITFMVVIAYAGIALTVAGRAVPVAPRSGWARAVVSGVVMLFMALVAANLVAIILLEGFAWVLPDNPDSYNLLQQLGIG